MNPTETGVQTGDVKVLLHLLDELIDAEVAAHGADSPVRVALAAAAAPLIDAAGCAGDGVPQIPQPSAESSAAAEPESPARAPHVLPPWASA